jgi:peptidoglycan hydrolase-like protein with peptidoglycan-binding domain
MIVDYVKSAPLGIGSSGKGVEELQRILFVDGQFGPLTRSAVKKWQEKHGLPGTGIVDMVTAAAMDGAPAPSTLPEPAKKWTVIDTNSNTTAMANAIKAAGIVTVIRYINPLSATSWKAIKTEEARTLAEAGLRVGLVCEGWGGSDNFSHNDITAATGARDGAFCAHYAGAVVGAPRRAGIYAAIDNDTNQNQIETLVLPYMRAFKAALGDKYRAGIYGPGSACAAALDGGCATLAWLANARKWSGRVEFKNSKRWSLLQHEESNWMGLSIDPDEINPTNTDFGDFVPFSS